MLLAGLMPFGVVAFIGLEWFGYCLFWRFLPWYSTPILLLGCILNLFGFIGLELFSYCFATW